MSVWKRIYKTILLLFVMNGVITIRRLMEYPAICAGILTLFVLLEVLPCYERGLRLRLQILAGGTGINLYFTSPPIWPLHAILD